MVTLRVVDPDPEPGRAPVIRFGTAASARGLHTIVNTAFVSTYPPQRCGIATFTADLAKAVGHSEIVALQPPEKTGFYPSEVGRRIARDVPSDYPSAARWVDSRPFDAVSIQHEYGIWGGPDGGYVLDFIDGLRTPIVTTLHTVLQNPSPSQRRILLELVHASAATVVMSSSAAELLSRSYGIDASQVEIVPHGVPYLPLVDSDTVKPQLGLKGHKVLLSFGLIGPGKGYEAAIAAMPAVVRADPTAIYVIVGATHPELIRREGESYRKKLVDLASSSGVANHVRFVGRYVDMTELGMWLTAADIFVTPYPNLEQIVSGTLAYAMGAGKAIVSTPYAYANERLAEGRGRLVAAGSVDALAEALIELALNSNLRLEHGRKAYAHSRGMLWPEVGATYSKIFARVAGLSTKPDLAAVPMAALAVASA